MGSCDIDHAQEDVLQKLQTQEAFLPASLVEPLRRFIQAGQSQLVLNELFHLLKKYDLAAAEEREARNEQFLLLIGHK
jgi:hypothetical protein